MLPRRRIELGINALALFFLFGFLMCSLTVLLLSFPGSALEPVWRLNPDARNAFMRMGWLAFLLMTVVGTACFVASIGLARKLEWGRRVAIGVLAVNLLGDTLSAVIRHDPRTLIGLPIGGAMIWFLSTRRARSVFQAVLVAFFVISANTSWAAKADLLARDLAAIRALDAAYAKAWLSNDRSTVEALFTADAVIIPQNNQPITGRDAMAKFWWPAGGGKTIIKTFESAPAEVGGSGNLGFSRGTYHFTFDYVTKDGTLKLENRGNYLMLFRRTNGVWKITHRMWSDLPRR